MSGAVSADWVLPVDGPPVRNAFVAWDDGRITEVGEGRAERHYEGGVILPGLVNAHSHLEYAVYAGFGDGEPFAGWLATHIARKRALGHDDMLAIARRGAEYRGFRARLRTGACQQGRSRFRDRLRGARAWRPAARPYRC